MKIYYYLNKQKNLKKISNYIMFMEISFHAIAVRHYIFWNHKFRINSIVILFLDILFCTEL